MLRISRSEGGILYIGGAGRCFRDRVGEHRHAVTNNDSNQPVARHFSKANHSLSDMEIQALVPFSGSNDTDSRKSKKCVSFLNLNNLFPRYQRAFFSHLALTCSCLHLQTSTV